MALGEEKTSTDEHICLKWGGYVDIILFYFHDHFMMHFKLHQLGGLYLQQM